ncbi:MAG: cytochrome c5 family protein [Alphaproteobacteria bacterium]|nr:MAG: cytochrome c5 family protein [Alphaproteobacteria bacterium]
MRPWKSSVKIATAALSLFVWTLSTWPGADAQDGDDVMPSDPYLAELYADTCMACHANPDSGAPMTGDVVEWEARLAQGEDVLLDHVIDGFKGMPPLGSCSDCSEQDFIDLIDFMATGG